MGFVIDHGGSLGTPMMGVAAAAGGGRYNLQDNSAAIYAMANGQRSANVRGQELEFAERESLRLRGMESQRMQLQDLMQRRELGFADLQQLRRIYADQAQARYAQMGAMVRQTSAQRHERGMAGFQAGVQRDRDERQFGFQIARDQMTNRFQRDRDRRLDRYQRERDERLDGYQEERDFRLAGVDAVRDDRQFGQRVELFERDKEAQAERDRRLAEIEAERDQLLHGQRAELFAADAGVQAERDRRLALLDREKQMLLDEQQAARDERMHDQRVDLFGREQSALADRDQRLFGQQLTRDEATFGRELSMREMLFEQAMAEQDAGFAQNMEREILRAELQMGIEEGRFSMAQQQELAKLDQAESWIKSQQGWSEEQKRRALDQIHAQRVGIEPSLLPQASPWADGREPGKYFNDEETGTRWYVEPEGKLKQIGELQQSNDDPQIAQLKQLQQEAMAAGDVEGANLAGQELAKLESAAFQQRLQDKVTTVVDPITNQPRLATIDYRGDIQFLDDDQQGESTERASFEDFQKQYDAVYQSLLVGDDTPATLPTRDEVMQEMRERREAFEQFEPGQRQPSRSSIDPAERREYQRLKQENPQLLEFLYSPDEMAAIEGQGQPTQQPESPSPLGQALGAFSGMLGGGPSKFDQMQQEFHRAGALTPRIKQDLATIEKYDEFERKQESQIKKRVLWQEIHHEELKNLTNEEKAAKVRKAYPLAKPTVTPAQAQAAEKRLAEAQQRIASGQRGANVAAQPLPQNAKPSDLKVGQAYSVLSPTGETWVYRWDGKRLVAAN